MWCDNLQIETRWGGSSLQIIIKLPKNVSFNKKIKGWLRSAPLIEPIFDRADFKLNCLTIYR